MLVYMCKCGLGIVITAIPAMFLGMCPVIHYKGSFGVCGPCHWQCQPNVHVWKLALTAAGSIQLDILKADYSICRLEIRVTE